MRINLTRGVLMGHIADASLVSSHDVLWNHFRGQSIKMTRQDAAALRWPLAHCAGRGVVSRPKVARVPRGQCTGSQPPSGRQLDWTWGWHVSRWLEGFRVTWLRDQRPPDQTKNHGTSTETNKTSAKKRTRRSPMLTHETSLVSGASVVGMTNGACHRPSHLPAGIPGISTAQR
jgi:hypothetical protein